MDTDAWESSKENVLPLKGGRCVKKIDRTFGEVHDVAKTTQDRERKTIKDEFEAAILNDEVDDPLETWLSYISWCRQEFPDGNAGDTLKLYERCARKFVDYEQYRNDTRYLRIWLNFADGATDPVDIFKFLLSREIGTTLALLYEAYALALETKGSKKQANLVYEEGIQKNAQPLERLKRRHRDYQVRLTDDLKANMEAMSFGALADSNDGRKTLGRLARTRNGLLPVHHTRIGQQTQSSRPAAKRRASNTGGVPVFVDDDEENQPPNQDTVAKVWSHMPTNTSVRKENTLTAGRWTGMGGSEDVPISAGYQSIDFPVYRDESNNEEEARQSLSARLLDHSGPSLQESRKRGEELMQNPLQNFRKPTKHSDDSMAWKQHGRLSLVDANGGEISIEEVRAQSLTYRYAASDAQLPETTKAGEADVDMDLDTDVTTQKRPQDDTHTQPIPRKILDFTTPALNQLKTPLCTSNNINAGKGLSFLSSVTDRRADESNDPTHDTTSTSTEAKPSQKRLKTDDYAQSHGKSVPSGTRQPVPKPRPTNKDGSVQTSPTADSDKNENKTIPPVLQDALTTNVEDDPFGVRNTLESDNGNNYPGDKPIIEEELVNSDPSMSSTTAQNQANSHTEATEKTITSTLTNTSAIIDKERSQMADGIHLPPSVRGVFEDDTSSADIHQAVEAQRTCTRESLSNTLGFDMFMDDTEKLDDAVATSAANASPVAVQVTCSVEPPTHTQTSAVTNTQCEQGVASDNSQQVNAVVDSEVKVNTGEREKHTLNMDTESEQRHEVVIKQEYGGGVEVVSETLEGEANSLQVRPASAEDDDGFRMPLDVKHRDGDQVHPEFQQHMPKFHEENSDGEANDTTDKEKHAPISPTITTKLATADLFDIFRSRPLPGDEDGDTLHLMPFLSGANHSSAENGGSPAHNRGFNLPMSPATNSAHTASSVAEHFQIFQDPTMTGTIKPLLPPTNSSSDEEKKSTESGKVQIFQDTENNENNPNLLDSARKSSANPMSHSILRADGERKPIASLEIIANEEQDLYVEVEDQAHVLAVPEGRVTNADVLRQGGTLSLDTSINRISAVNPNNAAVVSDDASIRETTLDAEATGVEILSVEVEPRLDILTEQEDDDFVVFEDQTATAPDASRSLAAIGHPHHTTDSADSAVDSDEDISRRSDVALNISAGDNALAPHMSSILSGKRGSNLSLILETSRDGENALEMHTLASSQENATITADKPLSTEVGQINVDADADILRNPVSEKSLLFMNDHVKETVQRFDGYHQSSETLAIPFNFQVPGSFTLANGDTVFLQTILKPGGKEADASIFLLVTPDDEDAPDITAMLDDCSQSCGLSVSPSPSTWEFYLSRTFYARFEASAQQQCGYKSIPWMTTYHVYGNAHMYTTAHSDYCTIQDLIDSTRSAGEPLEEAMVLFYTVELLKAVQILHSNQIVLNGFCSDRILLRHGNMMSLSDVWAADGSGGWEEHGIFLKDLSQGIDMKLFTPGTRFTGPMPRWGSIPNHEEWSYEVDMFDVANTIHKLMHGSGLALKNMGSQWMPSTAIPSTWRVELWNGVMRDLINLDDGTGDTSFDAVSCIRKKIESVIQSDDELSRRIKKLLLRQSIALYNSS